MFRSTISVLFVSKRNAIRGIMAESMLNYYGKGRFKAFSAGIHPAGNVPPYVLQLLSENGLPSTGFRSKSLNEFTQHYSAEIDLVLTLSDSTAEEAREEWPGSPIVCHWGIDDPIAMLQPQVGAERNALLETYRQLELRISVLAFLPIEDLRFLSLENALNDIGRLPRLGRF